MSRTALLRRPLMLGSIVIGTGALVASCAVAGVLRDAAPDGSDATTVDDLGVTTDAPPTDAPSFPCTGTTCIVANGIGACVNGSCQIGSCSMGYSDIDHVPMNGCECMAGTLSTSCGTPTDQMTIAPGGMRMVEGILAVTAGEHWLRVNFAMGGHPRVRFTTNPNMAYHFDVVSGCGASQQFMCPDRPAGGTGLTEWEYFDNPNDAGVDPDGGVPARMNPYPATAYIKVTTTANATACMRYTLVLSN